ARPVGVRRHDVRDAGRQAARLALPREARGRPPDRIELEVERKRVDRARAFREREVMIEPVRRALSNEDPGERVGQLVVDLGVLEGRVGGEAAAPPYGRRAGEGVMVDELDASALERAGLAGLRVDAPDPLQGELLALGDAEGALAAVPVAGKDHRVALDGVEDAIRVEARLDVES